MRPARLVFLVIAALIVARLYIVEGAHAAGGGLGIVAITGAMIWFSRFLAEYLLPLGFWASKATDFKHPERSAAAIALIGWVLLLLAAWATYFLPLARSP